MVVTSVVELLPGVLSIGLNIPVTPCDEWNSIFRVVGQPVPGHPREVRPKFRNEIPDNVCSIRSPTVLFLGISQTHSRWLHNYSSIFITLNEALYMTVRTCAPYRAWDYHN